jgi:hypothetical protein
MATYITAEDPIRLSVLVVDLPNQLLGRAARFGMKIFGVDASAPSGLALCTAGGGLPAIARVARSRGRAADTRGAQIGLAEGGLSTVPRRGSPAPPDAE